MSRPQTPAERQRAYRQRKKNSDFANKDAVLEFLESLPRVRVSEDGPYTSADRARDFIATFTGTEHGRRVFSQIAVICSPAVRPEEANNHGTLAFKAGMRRVMDELTYCFVVKAPLKIEKTEDT